MGEEQVGIDLKKYWREFKSTRNIFSSGILIQIKNKVQKKDKKEEKMALSVY